MNHYGEEPPSLDLRLHKCRPTLYLELHSMHSENAIYHGFRQKEVDRREQSLNFKT